MTIERDVEAGPLHREQIVPGVGVSAEDQEDGGHGAEGKQRPRDK